jgi:hypothetical protein
MRHFAGIVFALCLALVPVRGMARVYTTVIAVPLQETVFVENGAASEYVRLSGKAHFIVHVDGDGQRHHEMSRVSYSAQLVLLAVRGTGLTSGGKYVATGAGASSGTTRLPGGFSLQGTYKLTHLPHQEFPVTGFVALNDRGSVTGAMATTSLVSYWRADGNASDARGENPGALVGAVSFIAGRVQQAFKFSGAGRVEVTDSSTLEPAQLTLMAWVRNSGLPGANLYIASKGAQTCIAASYALYTGLGSLFFYVNDGVNLVRSPDAGPAVWDGNWHFVAGTYDGSNVRLYVDGIEAGTGTPATLAIKYDLPTSQNFYIGSFEGACSLPFIGDVDEVRFFNRALGAGEVLTVYNATP